MTLGKKEGLILIQMKVTTQLLVAIIACDLVDSIKDTNSLIAYQPKSFFKDDPCLRQFRIDMSRNLHHNMT